MVSKSVSPGANLLRNSRLFAMPKPLPPPLTFRLGRQDPAPYPTVQAITTPTSSRVRGNWGLKRDIPKKITHTTMRVMELDTLERFMTFESANDDVLTVKKWQEIDMPLTKGPSLRGGDGYGDVSKESVFDDDMSAGEHYKWKYWGPFLLDMPANEFARYLEKIIKPRKAEFLLFVAKRQAESRDAAPTGAELPEPDLDALRADLTLLVGYVADFLDMPRVGRPYRTHPSAGLHYTRSRAHIPNDPEYGPRSSRPVLGRSLNAGIAGAPVVGVGGVAAVLRENSNYFDGGRIHNDRRHVRDYEPLSAYVSTRGRVMLDVKPAVPHEEAIGLASRGAGTEWGIGAGDRGSVKDDLKSLVPKSLSEWRFWGGSEDAGNGRRAEGLAAPKSKISGAFGLPGSARSGNGDPRGEIIDRFLADFGKK